jgi:RNA-directed DNA polymerase
MTTEQKEQYKLVGKQAFIRNEMVRLGFWPPSEAKQAEFDSVEAELKPLYDELVVYRKELNTVEKEIALVGDIPTLLAEIRKNRIERSRLDRARRKGEREKTQEKKKEEDKNWRVTTLPHLGVGVSAGLNYTGETTKTIATASELAKAIGIAERDLAFLTYNRLADGTDHYNRFTIPKKKGGVRVISAPKKRLRQAQEWVLHTILEPLPVHEAAMAFRPGRCITHNAAAHTGKEIVIRVDLKDFFPSLGLARVKQFFQKEGFNEGIATILALLCTEAPRVPVVFDGQKRFAAVGPRGVPQGACTSPALTNLLCRRLDARLTGAAAKWGFTYTRYADDLVFSHEKSDAKIGGFLALVRQILADEKLTENEKKTLISRPQHRQTVTGLVVNVDKTDATPRVSREDIRKFRAILHHCKTKGVEAVSETLGKDAKSYVHGYLSFLRMVRPEVAEKLVVGHDWL